MLGASTALAWCFPDEASERAEAVLVPAVWSLEVANALLVGERQKRRRQPEVLRCLTSSLGSLPVVEDTQTAAERRAALATLDGRLEKAARAAGVEIFSGR